MSIETKLVKELAVQFLTNFENRINQDSPLADQAFLRVVSGNQALFIAEIIKLAQSKSRANLALTAFGEELEKIGAEYGIVKKPAQAAILNISLPAVDLTVIPQTAIFTGDSNGVQYFPDNQAIASGGEALLTVTAERTGTDGNLNDGETLSINSQIPGAETVATVLSTDTFGINEEQENSYQRRVLTAIRRRLGGYGFIDNRQWAEETPGVIEAFPFTGRPGIIGSVPPERTIYIEADPTIDPEGIAPPALLDAARDSLNTDPETGISRLTLGMTDEKLFVESITRILIYVEVRGLITPPGQEILVQDAIDDTLAAHLLNLKMFISGLDAPEDKNDIITDLSLSDIVQDILRINNSSASGVGFGLSPGTFVGQYTLFPGELAKLGGVNYA
jgi:hypothetical protein